MTCDRKSSLNPVQNEKERLMLQVMVLMLAHAVKVLTELGQTSTTTFMFTA